MTPARVQESVIFPSAQAMKDMRDTILICEQTKSACCATCMVSTKDIALKLNRVEGRKLYHVTLQLMPRPSLPET